MTLLTLLSHLEAMTAPAVWARFLAGTLLVLSVSCRDSTSFAPVHEFRVVFSGTQSGATTIIGPPVVPGDASRDYVLLSNGIDNGVAIPYQVYANRAASMVSSSGRDQVIMYFNPNVMGTGVYGRAACPDPAAVGGCFDVYAAFGLPAGGGTPALMLRSLGNEDSLVVEVFTSDRIRARFFGRFTLTPGTGGRSDTVNVTNGVVDAVRP
jgi:hypothetical protein